MVAPMIPYALRRAALLLCWAAAAEAQEVEASAAPRSAPSADYAGRVASGLPAPSDQAWATVAASQAHNEVPREVLDQWRPFVYPSSPWTETRLPALPAVDPEQQIAGRTVTLDAGLLALGVVSVADFGAAGSGDADATDAIQQAINFARDHALVCYFPAGDYLVSSTLYAQQLLHIHPESGELLVDRHRQCVLVGSTAGQGRARLVLKEGTFPEYDANRRNFVLHFRSTRPPAPTGDGKDWPGPLDLESNADHYNASIRSIDIVIRPGNAGASGLRMQGAEGCSISDINITFEKAPSGTGEVNGHVGLQGSPGSGSGVHSVTVTGGRIGIDTRGTERFGADWQRTGTQPTATMSRITLRDQSDWALYNRSRGPLIGVGWRIESSRPGPVICFDWEWLLFPFNSSAALIDSVIEYRLPPETPSPAVVATAADPQRNRSFYFNNVFIKGASAVQDAEKTALGEGWTHLVHLAVHHQPVAFGPEGRFRPAETIYVDGKPWEHKVFVRQQADTAPPDDLQTRHAWGDFPSFDSPGAVPVTNFGAKGDGKTDDTAALQAALDSGKTLIVPRGTFLINDTLQLRPDTKLVGVHKWWSVIFTRQTEEATFGRLPRSSEEGLAVIKKGRPLLQTPDTPEASVKLGFLSLQHGWPLRSHNGWRVKDAEGKWTADYTNAKGACPDEAFVETYPLLWRCGGASVVRDLHFEPLKQYSYHYGIYDEKVKDIETFNGGIFIHPFIQVRGHGGGKFFNFFYHGFLPYRRDGGILTVEGTKEPLQFYHLHAQHCSAEYSVRLVRAANVDIFGTKTEHHTSFLLLQDSDNVRIFGHGGIATPAPGSHHYLFDRSRNFLLSNFAEQANFHETRRAGRPGWSTMHLSNIDEYDGLLEITANGDKLTLAPMTRPILYLRGNPTGSGLAD